MPSSCHVVSGFFLLSVFLFGSNSSKISEDASKIIRCIRSCASSFCKSISVHFVKSVCPSRIGARSARRRVCEASKANVSILSKSTESIGLNSRSMRTMLGQTISYSRRSFSASTCVFGGVGLGVPPSLDSCGRKVNGIPKIFTYSGVNNSLSEAKS